LITKSNSGFLFFCLSIDVTKDMKKAEMAQYLPPEPPSVARLMVSD